MQTVAVHIVRYNQSLSMVLDCVRSVLRQTLSSYSVTVTDNGSSDSIKAELLSLLGDNPRFHYEESETNLGFAGAHNRFIFHCTENIVVPLNPDTIMPPSYRRDHLQRVARNFAGKTLFTAEQLEDVVAYLATLKE